jgi:hypothetical protein
MTTPKENYPVPYVLDDDEVEKIYNEGLQAFKERKEFHESPYAKAGTDVPDDEYQRGYEWRRGWNDAAIDASAPLLCPSCKQVMQGNGYSVWCETEGCPIGRING